MNRENKYSAFTLVEMLIVMGIIIILMGLGVTAGRFAINQANDAAHQNAAGQIYQALQAYYTDNREFPSDICTVDNSCTVEELVGTVASPGILADYMDGGTFDGGSPATYTYFTDSLGQSVLVCVTLGGQADEKGRGIYCEGNAFNSSELVGLSTAVANNELEVGDADYTAVGAQGAEHGSNWDEGVESSPWSAGTNVAGGGA